MKRSESKPRKRKPNCCPGRIRHWFTDYGMVGSVRPTCARCGAPNPKWKGPDLASLHRHTSGGSDAY